MMNSIKWFKNANIYTLNGLIKDASLLVSNGRIEQIITAIDDGVTADEVIDVKGALLIPGFVDVHVHGGFGFDVMSGNPQDIEGMSRFHASKGTTSFLPTTLTHQRSKIEKAIQSIVSVMKKGTSGAEVIGIHLEGPFLNVARCGAQNPEHIRLGSQEEMEAYMLLAEGNIRLMTIAPEQAGAMEIIEYCTSKGITISIGHSDASYEVVQQAVRCGASHITHLFNGMSPLHHREPGVAGSALIMDELAVEIICDGIHMHKDVVKYVFQVKPSEQVVLITDCVEAAGCSDGEYQLGSLPVVMKDGQIRLISDDGTPGSLAGSSLTMDQALRNSIQFTGLPLERILPAMTINPARQIGIDKRKGSIEAGKDADLVILDHQLQVQATYVKGQKVFDGGQIK